MTPIKLATFQHNLKDVVEYTEKQITEFNQVTEELKLLLENGPSARDYLLVDEFFHSLRDYQFKISVFSSRFKAVIPVLHIFALHNVDPEVYKKVKTSTTNTVKLYASYTSKLMEADDLAEKLLKLIESTSIQYNTLISALKNR